jgi:carboxybiotin decarboxylase
VPDPLPRGGLTVEIIWNSMGVAHMAWQQVVMLCVACLLLWLAIHKGFEPLLLVPIGFGALMANLPLAGLMAGPEGVMPGGLFHYLFKGLELEIFPPLIFLGLGALTDFGPLLSNPKTFLLGAAAQLGVFGTFLVATQIGFTPKEAASIGIIGGADGPTSIYLTMKLAPHLLGAIAVSAYSYMALVPLIQPPIMRLLTTKKERAIRMEAGFDVPRWIRIIFPIAVTILGALIVPAATSLIGLLMFGNLLRECGVTERLTRSAQNELINLVTIVLGLCVGVSMDGPGFLHIATLKILVLGCVAFALSTAGGVLLGKLMAIMPGSPVNPLIGAAGVSAVPMAARVAHNVGQETDPHNYLLMHAMGPNVAGVIGTAIAAGGLLALLR